MCALFSALMQVYGYALFKSGKQAAVKYPIEGYTEDVAGRSFHHGKQATQIPAPSAMTAPQSSTLHMSYLSAVFCAVWCAQGASCSVCG